MPKFSAYMRGEKGNTGETGQASLLDGVVNSFNELPNIASLSQDRNYVYYVKEEDGIHLYISEKGEYWQDLGVATAGFSTTQYASASTKEWFPGVQPDVTITPHGEQLTTGLKSFDFHFDIPASQPAGFSTNQSTSVSTLDWNEPATVEIIPDEESPDWEKSFNFNFGIPTGRPAGFGEPEANIVQIPLQLNTKKDSNAIITNEDVQNLIINVDPKINSYGQLFAPGDKGTLLKGLSVDNYGGTILGSKITSSTRSLTTAIINTTFSNGIPIKSGKNYYISFSIKLVSGTCNGLSFYLISNSSSPTSSQITQLPSSYSSIQPTSTSASYKINVTGKTNGTAVALYVKSSSNASNAIIEISNLKINSLETPLSSSYSYTVSLSKWTSINLYKTKKNIFITSPKSSTTVGINYTINSNNSIDISGAPSSSITSRKIGLYGADSSYITSLYPIFGKMKGGDKFYAQLLGASSDINLFFQWNDSNGTILSSNTVGSTGEIITIPSNAKYGYIALYLTNLTLNTQLNYHVIPFIAKSEISLNFEDTEGSITSITTSSSNNFYGGSIDLNEKKINSTWKAITTSTSSDFTRVNNKQFYLKNTVIPDSLRDGSIYAIRSKEFNIYTSDTTEDGICYLDGNGNIRFNTFSEYASASDMMNMFESLTFYYPSTETITYDIDIPDIEFYSDYNYLWADSGDITIAYLTNEDPYVNIIVDPNSPDYAKKFIYEFGIPAGESAGFGTISSTVEMLNHLSTAVFNIEEGGTNKHKDLMFKLGIPQAHPASFSTVAANAYDVEWNENPEASITTSGNDWEKNFDFSFGIPHGRPAGFSTEMGVSVTTLPFTSNATVSVIPDENSPDYAKKFDFDFGIPSGVPGGFGAVSVSTLQVDALTPAEVTITTSGPDTAKNFDFLFKIPQGKSSGSAGGYIGTYIKRSFTSTSIDSTSTIYWDNNILHIKNQNNNTIPICIVNNENQDVASTFKLDKENENILYYGDSPFDGDVYLIAESAIPEFIVHSVSTVPNNANAQVQAQYIDDDLSQVYLDFYVPKGEKGDKGDSPLTIHHVDVISLTNEEDSPHADVEVNSASEATITFYLPRGEKGEKGDSALTIDEVNVYALSTGGIPHTSTHINENSAIIDFYLPPGLQGDQGPQGEVGVGISSIENLGTVGLTTTYQINYSSTNIVSTTFEVINGSKGDQGDPGVGISFIENLGTVGLTTTYQINYTNNNSTTFEVINGEQGPQGEPGNSIKSIVKTNTNLTTREDTYTITFTDNSTTTYIIKNGEKGDKGDTALTISNISITTLAEGETNPHAEVTTDANHDVSIEFYLPRGATGTGISSITKGQPEGLIDNYIINYDNGTTTGYQIINGNGISSITTNGSNGLVDNYIINYDNGTSTTFQVTNGNGINSITFDSLSETGNVYNVNYSNGTIDTILAPKGPQGIQGIQGNAGTTGVGISSITYVDSNGLQDIYRINLTNNSYYDFTITNGAVVGDIRSIIYTTTDPGSNTALTTGNIILVYDEE